MKLVINDLVDLLTGNDPSTATSKSGSRRRDPYGDVSTVLRSGLRGGIDDALEAAGSIAGSALGPLGALGGGLLARELGSLLGLSAHRQPRGENPAQPIYVAMPGVSEQLAELVNLTRAAQLRSAGGGLDDLTAQVALANQRAGLIPEVL